MHANGAPIYLIGTFKDQVPDDKQHKKINEYLCTSLKLNAIAPTLAKNTKNNLVFWPIDNSKGVNGDPVIQQLRVEIMDTVSKMSHIKMMVPLVWTRIYDRLIETKNRNMSINDVIDISNKYGIVDEQQVTAMLALFHQLGMLLHFNKTNELRDLVILEPQWIVDALTMVIRDFELHPYNDDLNGNLLMDHADDFMKLKNESITSVQLLHRLWKKEDNNSDIDYTRRKFLVSIMEQMTLSSPWRFGEDFTSLTENGNDDSDNFMPLLPPPTQYLIPSNLRLFRGKDIELELKEKIEGRITLPKFEKITEPITPNCFVVDFSQSFLPIGFFDRLICLLVAYSSACFQDSRTPIVANGIALMSFGMNDFRIDEDLHHSRIIVIAGEGCDHLLVLRTIESMIGKLKDEIMGTLLKYHVFAIVWQKEGKKCSLIDIDKAREAVNKKMQSIRDINEDIIKISEFDKLWVISSAESEAAEHIRQVTQTMAVGKSNHIFIIHSESDESNMIVKKLGNDILPYGVKSQYDMSSIDIIKKDIDSSMCVVVLLVDKIFQNIKVEESLMYIYSLLKNKKRMPIILLQEGRDTSSTRSVGTTHPIIATAKKGEVREILENIDEPIVVRHRSHERVMFFNEFCTKIHKSCVSIVKNIEIDDNSSSLISYLCFWSHYKTEAGITARLLHEKIEIRCRARQDENPSLLSSVKTFIDSDDLKDLRLLLEHVKKSRFLVAILTKKYLTRPWCLAELHAAITYNVPIIPLNVIGGGYDFTEARLFLEKLTPETFDIANRGPNSTDTTASSILISLGIDISQFGKQLSNILPNVIASSFNPLGGGRVMEAEIDTIIDRFIN